MFKVKQLVRYELMQSDSKAHTFNLHGMLPRDDGNELGRGEFKNDLGQCSAVQYVSRWPYKEKGPTEDEMVGWHHQLDRHESEQAPGIGDGEGSLACCSPWVAKSQT